MSIYDIDIRTLGGDPADLRAWRGHPVLAVNVASKCGLTPQYAQLEELWRRFDDQGLIVAGFPCNQFGGQEPGTSGEIAQFCSATYGVTFPLFEKMDVNGSDRHPLYGILTEAADDEGKAGDVAWNFEKFLIDGTGSVVARFRPQVTPDDPALVAAVEKLLA
ncbi:glutathione peroxidase [Stackebrandtia soli]|uniref:glutathione peroxidase n=1 Tax=Stackebrandtia soli TaxID=1892856 RepID=UPI0039E89EDD